MSDLTFYPLREKGARYAPGVSCPGAWTWAPKWLIYPADLAHIDALTSAGWERGGLIQDTWAALSVLCGQLSDIRLLRPSGVDVSDMELWAPAEDISRVESLPVILAFTLSEQEARHADSLGIVYTPRTIPPTNFGEMGLIANAEERRWIRCPIAKLPQKSQELQQRLSAALSRLHGERSLVCPIWLERWKEIQSMARKLAGDYWRAYQDTQVERPQPINIWTINRGEAAWAAMTQVQSGAHESINNTDGWKEKRMIYNGLHQGLTVPGYSIRREKTELDYWLQHPEDVKAPVDADLASQEILRHLNALDDWEADIVTLAPIYLLARGEDEVYLSPEQLLKDIGRQPTRNQAGYGNTYRPAETQRIIDAFERMAWMQLKVRQSVIRRRGARPAPITAEAPYLIITERIWQEPLDDAGPRRFLGWKYQITWLKHFTGSTEAGKQLGILLKKSFAYRQDQRWEKRLSRHLAIDLCVAAHSGQRGIHRTIRSVLEQNGLMPTERDRTHPGDYASQFEQAMNNLKRDKVIGDWMPKIDRETLPPRGWLDLWLDSTFYVTQAPAALEGGYQKMIDARKPRKKG